MNSPTNRAIQAPQRLSWSDLERRDQTLQYPRERKDLRGGSRLSPAKADLDRPHFWIFKMWEGKERGRATGGANL